MADLAGTGEGVVSQVKPQLQRRNNFLPFRQMSGPFTGELFQPKTQPIFHDSS